MLYCVKPHLSLCKIVLHFFKYTFSPNSHNEEERRIDLLCILRRFLECNLIISEVTRADHGDFVTVPPSIAINNEVVFGISPKHVILMNRRNDYVWSG